MVASLLLTKPEEPVPHMIQFLQDKKGIGAPPLSKDERIELDTLRAEYKKLLEKKAKQEGDNSSDKKKEAHDSASDSECDEELQD